MVVHVRLAHMSRSRTRGAEVRGEALDAVVTAVSALAPATRMRVQTILADGDALHVSTGEWYPLADYLDTLDDIESAVGSSVLHRIGMQLPLSTDSEVDSQDPQAVLRDLDEAYASVHRGQRAGGFEFRRVDVERGIVRSTTPYPDEFDRGILDAAFAGRNATDFYARVTPSTGFGLPACDTEYEISW